MDASPAFTGDEPEAFADHWIQCFVKTDVFAYGIIAFGQTVELDFVFEPFFAAPTQLRRPPRLTRTHEPASKQDNYWRTSDAGSLSGGG